MTLGTVLGDYFCIVTIRELLLRNRPIVSDAGFNGQHILVA